MASRQGFSFVLDDNADDDAGSIVTSSEISLLDALGRSERIVNGRVVIDLTSLPPHFAHSMSGAPSRRRLSKRLDQKNAFLSRNTSNEPTNRNVLEGLPSSISKLHINKDNFTPPSFNKLTQASEAPNHSQQYSTLKNPKLGPELSKDNVINFNNCSFFGPSVGKDPENQGELFQSTGDVKPVDEILREPVKNKDFLEPLEHSAQSVINAPELISIAPAGSTNGKAPTRQTLNADPKNDNDIEDVLEQLRLFHSVGSGEGEPGLFNSGYFEESLHRWRKSVQCQNSIAGPNLTVNDLYAQAHTSPASNNSIKELSENTDASVRLPPEVLVDGRSEEYNREDILPSRVFQDSQLRRERNSKRVQQRIPISFRPSEAELRKRKAELSEISDELCSLSTHLNEKNDRLVQQEKEIAEREHALLELEINMENEIEKKANERFNAKEKEFREEVESIISRYDASVAALAKENRRLQGSLREVVGVNRRMRDQHRERVERLKNNLTSTNVNKIVIEPTSDTSRTAMETLSSQLKLDLLRKLLPDKSERPHSNAFTQTAKLEPAKESDMSGRLDLEALSDDPQLLKAIVAVYRALGSSRLAASTPTDLGTEDDFPCFDDENGVADLFLLFALDFARANPYGSWERMAIAEAACKHRDYIRKLAPPRPSPDPVGLHARLINRLVIVSGITTPEVLEPTLEEIALDLSSCVAKFAFIDAGAIDFVHPLLVPNRYNGRVSFLASTIFLNLCDEGGPAEKLKREHLLLENLEALANKVVVDRQRDPNAWSDFLALNLRSILQNIDIQG
ncbi:hypothetical protein HDU67_003215 [Dinochytrium kinnereticum]|nr:hypothetical protein HDU67_003215 [Dinochytrium kinnereticum]